MPFKPPKRSKVFTVIIVVAVGLFGLFWSLSSTYIHPPRNVPMLFENLTEKSYTTLGKQTPCWVTDGLDTAPVVFVLAHGYGGTRTSWADFAVRMRTRGYACILPAMPGQDASPFDSVGFGVTESSVLAEIAEAVRKQRGPSVKIVIGGKSLGGAAAWLATQKTDQADAVLTEGAFARFDEAMDHWLGHVVPGGAFLLRPLVWITTARTQIRPSSIVPLEAAAAWRGKPALVIQAAEDQIMSATHASRLVEASGATYFTVAGARHVECYSVDRDGFEAHVEQLVRSIPRRSGS